MATFPEWEKNKPAATQPLTVSAPAHDPNTGNAKTVEQVRVEQDWRNVVQSGVHQRHPLSINRDAPQVTNDPYDA